MIRVANSGTAMTIPSLPRRMRARTRQFWRQRNKLTPVCHDRTAPDSRVASSAIDAIAASMTNASARTSFFVGPAVRRRHALTVPGFAHHGHLLVVLAIGRRERGRAARRHQEALERHHRL